MTFRPREWCRRLCETLRHRLKAAGVDQRATNQALAEAARVLKPGGELLLMIIANEKWAKFAFGPLLSHGGPRGAAWWTTHVQQAGFQILEQGTRPLTFYLLARRL